MMKQKKDIKKPAESKPVVEEAVIEEVTAEEVEVIASVDAVEIEELPIAKPKLKDLVSKPRPIAKKILAKKGEHVLLCNLKHNGVVYKAGTKFTEPKAKLNDYLANGTVAIKG